MSRTPYAPSDPDGQAVAINDKGQAVGFSGKCSIPVEHHALLWQNGTATDLDNLRGIRHNAGFCHQQPRSSGRVIRPNPRDRHFLSRLPPAKRRDDHLNTLIPADSPCFCLRQQAPCFCLRQQAPSILAGRSPGVALQTGTGEVHTFLLTPITTKSPARAPRLPHEAR